MSLGAEGRTFQPHPEFRSKPERAQARARQPGNVAPVNLCNIVSAGLPFIIRAREIGDNIDQPGALDAQKRLDPLRVERWPLDWFNAQPCWTLAALVGPVPDSLMQWFIHAQTIPQGKRRLIRKKI